MLMLGLDVGSSSIKAGVLRDGKVVGKTVKAKYPTRYDGQRVEVEAGAILKALAKAVKEVGAAAKRVDCIGLTNMAPSWVAMGANGRALTAVVTHQDRRSVGEAEELERRVGKERHLELAGNRPFPGGISSTTWAWFCRHEPPVMRKADLCGHLNAFLHRNLTGARVTDPSNASFMGLYRTLELGGWSEELMEAVGAKRGQLPDVLMADEVGGRITAEAGRRFGLTAGTPMLVGCVDGSASILLAGNRPGQLVNVSGSTDVVALCTDRPRAHEKLLTRAVGVGRRWASVSTIAAAGSALQWAKEQFFFDMSWYKFEKLMVTLARRRKRGGADGVRFEPYLAGDRMSIEQKRGAFTGLTLSTTREDMLGAMVKALAEASAARLPILREANPGLRWGRTVILTGGVQGGLHEVLHRDWPGKWEFREEEEATLRGLGTMGRANR